MSVSPGKSADDEEGATYFNPKTGEMVTLRPRSGVVLGSPWIRVPDLGQTYLRAPAMQIWANPSTFDEHYVDHADEFGAKDEEDYAAQANEFYFEAENQGYRRKFDSNGAEYIYDPKTNMFWAYTIDGKTITFFKPTSNSYWYRQPGFVVKRQEELQVTNTERETMNGQSGFVCPIRGYPEMNRSARSQEGFASFEYCPCCLFQFGYHDDDKGISYDE
jgi:hypothetical protein